MASRFKSVFSAQWHEYGGDCYIEPIVLLEAKRLFRRPSQLSTHGYHVLGETAWLKMEHIISEGKICGLALVCNPPFRVLRASFALRVQQLAISQVKVRAGVTVNSQSKDIDVTFEHEGQTIVIAKLENNTFSQPPLAIFNSMSSVLTFEQWDKIPD